MCVWTKVGGKEGRRRWGLAGGGDQGLGGGGGGGRWGGVVDKRVCCVRACVCGAQPSRCVDEATGVPLVVVVVVETVCVWVCWVDREDDQMGLNGRSPL